jgi:hypothetical protein
VDGAVFQLYLNSWLEKYDLFWLQTLYVYSVAQLVVIVVVVVVVVANAAAV